MIIDRDLSQYVILDEDTILKAFQKIDQFKKGLIVAVTESGILKGVLTFGDIMRWLIRQKTADLTQPISSIINKSCISVTQEDRFDKIKSCLDKVLYVPVVDNRRHLIAVARKREPEDGIKIGKFSIDKISPAFIIAEIGNNHNGSLELAKQLVDEAGRAGADCAKFQMRDLETLYYNAGAADDIKENLGSQYTLDLLGRFQLSTQEMFEIFDYCKKKGILPLCTPWDEKSLRALEDYGMLAYKIASADLTNHDLLRIVAKTGKPVICSTGMSTEQEIIKAVDLLRSMGTQYILLHCNSTYPAPFKDVNLAYLDRLKEIGSCLVGYSGHERGSAVAIAAVARGAKVIEKHFTLDQRMEGNDHKVSLLPEEFKAMVNGIRSVESSIGEVSERKLSQGELINRVTLAKSLVINCDLEAGAIFEEKMFAIKSPGRGLQPNHKVDLIGKRAKRQLKTGDFLYPSDLVEEKIAARNYHFKRPWGLPVRYHDFKALLAKSNPDFLEFHLSYKDLDEDIGKYFDESYDLDLVVHSPEFFAGDHQLDLAAPDISYRERSIHELQRAIEVTRKLKPFFKMAKSTFIITNVGGFRRDGFLDPSNCDILYKVLANSLEELDKEGVEIIIQTMPPFPWNFGGQLYHNLFVNSNDSVDFCRRYGYRMCLDVSHSKLACNHLKYSFKEFIEEVGPFITHLHIADARGVDEEGLQISEGDIDFPALSEDLNKVTPKASFIPEIWQGHENGGEGFWIALGRLEGLF